MTDAISGTPATAAEINQFLAALTGIERAWIILDEAEQGGGNINDAIRLGGSAQVLTRAAAILAPHDFVEAHRLLEQAATLDAPPAPTQLALARSFQARGDEISASRWLRGAMLRARPDGALLLELAAIETDHAGAIVDAARSFRCRDAVTAAQAADALTACGKRKEARIAGDIAFQAGARDGDFLVLYSDLLADPALHNDPPLPPGPLGTPHEWTVATHAAQARLAAMYRRDNLVETACARENGEHWVDLPRLHALIADRIAQRTPFSWIRLGDGEARFLMHLHPPLRAPVPAREAQGMTQMIWYNWFGQDLAMVAPTALAEVGQALGTAIRNADLLGVSSAARLDSDDVHFGFCAALETYLAPLLAERPDRMLTDALMPLALNQEDPFLASWLRNLDFLGVVSPHPDLAGRLQRHLGIGTIASYDLPGESRLGRAREAEDRGTHFPGVYRHLLKTLWVPHPGAVFLVAGGLLGKIYCDRIRALGGIALDIGALADAWSGHNTRGIMLDASMQRQLPA